MRQITRQLFGCFLSALLLLVQSPAMAEKAYSTDQLDQLVAPIALYPDTVVAQILMASTYPLEIVEAQRWLGKNKGLADEQLDQQGKAQGWDPSVISMLHFPDILKLMSDNLDWTQDLGDAVLAQQADVMAAAQRMRKHAYDAGNLKTTEQQKVIVEQEVIRIEPATEVVYVPAYSPTTVYGPTWVVATPYYPWYSYPPSYWYPPGYAVGAGIAFGLGVAWGAAVWGDCDWGHGDINIDIDRNREINNFNGKWEHNAEHRKGVRYGDDATRQRFDKATRDARDQRITRDSERGFDRNGTRELGGGDGRGSSDRADRAGSLGDREKGDRGDRAGGLGDREQAGRGNSGSRDRATPATRDKSTNAARDRAGSSGLSSGTSSASRSSAPALARPSAPIAAAAPPGPPAIAGRRAAAAV